MSKKKKKAKSSNGKGRKRSVLLEEIKRLREEVIRLKAPDRVRQPGEHWYELVDVLGKDARRIVSPWKEPAYFMGNLAAVNILEVPESAKPEEVNTLLSVLQQAGLAPAMTLKPGVRFVRLATVDPVTEAVLDKASRSDSDEDPEAVGADTPDTANDGSEPTGDRLGNPESADVAPDSVGSGSHEERERPEESRA